MNSDLSMVRSLRKALESAGEGKGMARSVIEALGGASPEGSAAARMLLLGYPLHRSMKTLAESPSEEAALLSSLIIAAPKSSATLVGKSGETLAGTLERWVRARESRRLEHRVMRFRSLVTSGVLGGVTAMMASLGPLVGSLDFSGAAPPVDSTALLAGAAAMAAISSGVLGLYMSGRGFLVNVAVTLAVFLLVSTAAAPLAGFAPSIAWGVK